MPRVITTALVCAGFALGLAACGDAAGSTSGATSDASTDAAQHAAGDKAARDVASTPIPVDPKEYARLHNAALDPTRDEWDAALADLAVAGDAFTLVHLERVDRATLDATQSARLDATLAALTQRHPGDGPRLHPGDLVPLLERAAYTDLMCDPLERTLPPWARALVIAQLDDPALRAEVERLSAGHTPSFDTETLFSSMSARVPLYARRILDEAAE